MNIHPLFFGMNGQKNSIYCLLEEGKISAKYGWTNTFVLDVPDQKNIACL